MNQHIKLTRQYDRKTGIWTSRLEKLSPDITPELPRVFHNEHPARVPVSEMLDRAKKSAVSASTEQGSK
jgi:hypothetical protein